MYQSDVVKIVDVLYENNYIEKTINYKEVFSLLQITGIIITEDSYEENKNNYGRGKKK